MPLRGASGPGETARATTSRPSMRSTAKRGTPSPITICERSVTSAANLSKSTTTRSGPGSSPGGHERDASPTATVRGSVSPTRRSFGPCRSNSSPIGRPARAAAARTSAARRRRSSCEPCEQFRRAQSSPAATSGRARRRVGGGTEGGDDLRAALQHRRECCIEPLRHAACVGARGGSSEQHREVAMRATRRALGIAAAAGVLAFAGRRGRRRRRRRWSIRSSRWGRSRRGWHSRSRWSSSTRTTSSCSRRPTGQVKRVNDDGAAAGRARPDGQLQLRARPAGHRAGQVLQAQRLRLPLLERDDAGGRQRRRRRRAAAGQPARPLPVGRHDARPTRRRCTAAARSRRT